MTEFLSISMKVPYDTRGIVTQRFHHDTFARDLLPSLEKSEASSRCLI